VAIRKGISALNHAPTLLTKETQCGVGCIWHGRLRARAGDKQKRYGHKLSEAFLCGPPIRIFSPPARKVSESSKSEFRARSDPMP
jgi:hypothetical protein